MPCYTVREVEIEWRVASMDVLFAALQAEGLNPVKYADRIQFTGGSYQKGGTSLSLIDATLKERINRAYSAQIVRIKMKGYGWKEVKDKEGKLKFVKA